MLFGNRSVDLGKSTDPDDDLYEDFNYRCVPPLKREHVRGITGSNLLTLE